MLHGQAPRLHEWIVYVPSKSITGCGRTWVCRAVLPSARRAKKRTCQQKEIKSKFAKTKKPKKQQTCSRLLITVITPSGRGIATMAVIRLKVRDMLIALAVVIALTNLSSRSLSVTDDEAMGEGEGHELRHHMRKGKGGAGAGAGAGAGGGGAAGGGGGGDVGAAAVGGKQGQGGSSQEDAAREQRRLEREARVQEREQRQSQSRHGTGGGTGARDPGGGSSTTTSLRAATLANLKHSSSRASSRVERELDKTLGDFTSEIFDKRNGTLVGMAPLFAHLIIVRQNTSS
jgi:hypothetical protein